MIVNVRKERYKKEKILRKEKVERKMKKPNGRKSFPPKNPKLTFSGKNFFLRLKYMELEA